MSIGGDGLPYLSLDVKEIVDMYLHIRDIKYISEVLDIDDKTVSKILRQNGFKNFQSKSDFKNKEVVCQQGDFFNQLHEAALFAEANSLVQYQQAYTSISRCMNGQRKSYKGFRWYSW